MDEIISILNDNYKYAFLEAPQLHFYQHAYGYIKTIVDSKELSAVILKEHNRLKDKLKEIDEDPMLNINDREELSYRERKISLYSAYINLYKDVYIPLEDGSEGKNYKLSVRDPLFYIMGIENVPEKERSFYGWSFNNHFESYKKDLTLLHSKFIPLIKESKNEPLSSNLSAINFTFNTETGQFKYLNTEGILSPTSREFKLLKTLYLSPIRQAKYEELLNKQEKASSADKIMLTDIIKNLKLKLNILPRKKGKSHPDIIKNISKYGYKLDI